MRTYKKNQSNLEMNLKRYKKALNGTLVKMDGSMNIYSKRY